MSEDNNGYSSNTLIAFFAGAAVGALVVALTTPKRGSEVRDDIAGLGRRMKDKFGDLAQKGARALEGFREEPAPRTTTDQVGEAWKDLQKTASRMGTEAKVGLGEVAKDFRS